MMAIRAALWVIVLTTLAGCGERTASDSAAAAPPAKVQNPKAEGDLMTVTLSPEAEKHLAIQIVDVAMQNVTASRMLGGEVMVPAGKSIVISAPVAGTLAAPSGRIRGLGAIKRGEVIFELLPLQQSERDVRTDAERALKEADARLAEATQRLQRLELLLKDGAASARSVEEARANHAVAVADADAARQRAASAGRLPTGSRGELALIAPIDGVLTGIRAAAGQTVAAGSPVADMAQVTVIWIRVPVYAGDLSAIDTSAPAAIAVLGGESSGPWRDARRIAGPPAADASSASIDLFYELANTGAPPFRPGERVSARVPLKSSQRALVVPQSAVVYDVSGGTWVYELLRPHVYARRRVELGGQTGSNLIVRRGLNEGLKIVSVGAAELYSTEFFVNK